MVVLKRKDKDKSHLIKKGAHVRISLSRMLYD